MGMKRHEGQLFRLNGSTDMRLDSRGRVGDRRGETGVADSQFRYNYFFMARCTV